ncbi:hypothetical protein GeomeDRAFT_3374 [Geobacter metallireducens RCH3]|nr:hypothetical protein [Geobacter metallireducens]EHP83884.1 hypothetical protein GeomeDRAFT_3374 [Geobacter metallireducens RCH3]
MRKLPALASAIILSGLMAASLHAAQNPGSGNPQKQQAQVKRNSAPAPKKAVLSKRNRAKIEVEEMKKIKQQLQKDGTN